MKSLFITATGTNVGKTHTTLKLIEALAAQGIRPGVYKPVETGVSNTPSDAVALLHACQSVNPAFESLSTYDITAYTFMLPAAPFCADTDGKIDLQYIIDKHDMLLKKCDILLVEGAGGVMVPLTETYLTVHLIKELGARALLVTPSRLGCINDTLLSIMALRSFDIPFDWCVNLYEDKEDFSKVTQPYYDALFPEWWNVQNGIDDFVKQSVLAPSFTH
ncbi:Dethiobiotin synthetase [hydrothermal vent metagenome]|uniref:Dethiobiotin synthetase n=1 Tax=hydrothermal vent metagenome TaxID=652676 RepID=A0A1W1E844_9ZZZZ